MIDSDIIQLFRDFMAAKGCAPAPGLSILADDADHRYRIEGENKLNAIYQLRIDSGLGVGRVYNFKTGESWGFPEKGMRMRELTPEERTAMRTRIEQEAAARIVATAQAEAAARKRAMGIWARCNTAAPAPASEYVTRKGITPMQCRYWGSTCVVPVYCDGALWSLQFIAPDGQKRFLRNGRIKGGYAPLAAVGDAKDTILIAEGFATGCSLREALGVPVVVAFNAGNIEAVTQAMRVKYPDARLVICADNDLYTFDPKKRPKGFDPDMYPADDTEWDDWREKGLLVNPGIEKARAAAVKAGAHVIWPEFTLGGGPAKLTDFNDMHLSQGIDAVRERILVAVSANSQPVVDGGDDGITPDHPADLPYADMVSYLTDDCEPQIPLNMIERPFNILGHNDGQYFFLSKNSGQLVSFSASGMGSITNLYRLAPQEYWDQYYGGDKISSRKKAEMATNHLIIECHQRGVFRPQNIRGIGAWIDAGRVVIHCGDYLFVDGERINPYVFESKYVYPRLAATIKVGGTALGNKEASKLREICAMLSWENKLSGELLAGWCVIAPICAALPWRPHIWITGQSQSGKTTILSKIIKPLINDISIHIDGGTTEAAIRQTLGFDGRPIIYDEAEAESQRDLGIIEGVLSLARRSSSGGTVIKGSSSGEATAYTARSSFCFSGINPAIRHRADESRISQLVLKRAAANVAIDHYTQVKRAIKATITDAFANGLLMRTLNNIETILHNIDVFSDAASEVLSDQRAADQIGAMLAGLYSLTSTAVMTRESAMEWIKRHDWNMHTAISEQADPEKLIMFIATRTVRAATTLGKVVEETIGNLIQQARNHSSDVNENDAEKILRDHGIWPRNEGIWIANSSPKLQKLLSDTAWHSWKRTLSDIKGAERNNPVLFSPGLNSRSVTVPYSVFGIGNYMEEEILWG